MPISDNSDGPWGSGGKKKGSSKKDNNKNPLGQPGQGKTSGHVAWASARIGASNS